MSRRSPAPVLTKKSTLALRARDLFAEPLQPPPPNGARTRHRLPRQGEAMTARSPEGLMVRVEHRDDGSWWLMLPDRMENATTVITYPLVVQPMSVPKRRLIRQRDGTHRLPPGLRQPVRFLIQDTTGRRVRCLLASSDDGRIGSAHELGMDTHPTKHFTPLQRLRRRQVKVREQFPLEGPDILNPNISIRRVLLRCPIGKHRNKFLADVIRARHGPMHKGDLPALEQEITAAIDQHLRRHKRRWRIRGGGGPKPWKMPSSYARTLKPFNEARWQYQAYEEIEQEEPGIGDRRYID